MARRSKEVAEERETFSKLRDELTRQRQELPWEKVNKEYTF
jgi:predicted dithiol-disulfide oxidoreductase (DUF899 family)